MSERDAERLVDRLERDADKLERQSDELQDRVKGVGEDWERKRSDQSIPGTLPGEDREGGEQEHESPAQEAPPPEAGPSQAETAPEGAAGPPSDTGDESD
jgi:hypothetical protein